MLSYGERVRWERYNHIEESLRYWRTSSSYEVDAIIGEGRIAIEIKSTDEVKSRHTHGLKARLIVVSLDKHKRKINDVEVFPELEFLENLWKGMIV